MGQPLPKPEPRKRTKARKDRLEARDCVHCGTSFKPEAWRKPAVKYCSLRCYWDAAGERRAAKVKDLACLHCQTPIVIRYRARRNHRKMFCSPECSHKYNVGANNANWRGGAVKGRGSGWKAISESIRERDGRRCRWCGSTEAENRARLTVDHVRPWREFDNEREANSPDNLVSLCRKCHGKKSALENRWLRGDGLALVEYRRLVGAAAPRSYPQPKLHFGLGPPVQPIDYSARGKAISRAKKAYYAKPGVREEWAKRNRARVLSEEMRQRLSAQANAMWSDPGTRERMIAGMRKKRTA